MKLIVKKLHDKTDDSEIPKTPEERLDLVEQLRIHSGKFLYEYPTRLRRIIKVTRRK